MLKYFKILPYFFSILPFYLASGKDDITELSKKLMPSVVTVSTEKGVGSGFIISKDGYVFTNAHVISKLWDEQEYIKNSFKAYREKIVVIIQNKYKYSADIIGYDPRTDIGLLKIKSNKNFSFLKLGNSDNIKVGQKIIVLGSPLGLADTATVGVVSHVGRALSAGPAWEFPINVIQTDAAINPGNSGGPMIDLKGEVIGINYASTAKWSSEGIGFAIPINIAKYVKEKLIEKGTGKRIPYSYIGADFYYISDDLCKFLNIKGGILVETVYSNSPAQKAGINPGEIIISIDGKGVSTNDEKEVNDFVWKIATIPAGTSIEIKSIRNMNGMISEKKYNVVLEESPLTEIELEPYIYDEFGFTVKDITEPVYFKYTLPVHKGLWVSNVQGGPAEEAGFKVGDIIRMIGENEIYDNDGLKKCIKEMLIKKIDYIKVELLRKKEKIETFFYMRYPHKNRNVLILMLSDSFNFDDISALESKLLFYGIGIFFTGVSTGTVNLLENDTKKESIIIETSIDRLDIREYEAMILLSKEDDIEKYTPEIIQKIDTVLRHLLDYNKLIAANGSSVLILPQIYPRIENKKITFSQKYLEYLKKYKLNWTGNDVEVDDKLITSTGNSKSYRRFALEIIKNIR